ncbi:hypothetical protein BRCON_2214 [Candidatus Sumerlaea chitinivorans]|uniref:Uncharacterized protein n=1 Tax=Sumerlaea chitinivorans TaxID=2250252 RepID=A0A2Z4Y728_SUMC1|nr:hypothetical protein BRCON_2214 [Candidatus Sumerlaea chitinivorans]
MTHGQGAKADLWRGKNPRRLAERIIFLKDLRKADAKTPINAV